MNIIVLGSKGMAGHIIYEYLKQRGYDVDGFCRTPSHYEGFLNVESEQSRDFFINYPEVKNADFIINCIGVLVLDSDQYPSRTILLNSWWPHYLEESFKDSKTKVIHISTDCIFDGAIGGYIESDLSTETNLYGRSKALGEINNNKDLTLRMSIVGTEIKEKSRRSGLLNWVINNPDSEITGWTDSIWNGITTLQLAKHIEEYINSPTISGIYHLVPDFNISKYNLVSLIVDTFNCDKEVIKVPGKKENKTLVNTRKDRVFSEIPPYSVQLEELRDFKLKFLT